MAIYAQISCELPIELLKKGVGWQGRAVYVEAILFCRDRLTDGVINRNLLAAWMPDMSVSGKVKQLDSMVASGALVHHDEGWAFPPHVWAKWGKMRADVEAARESEAARKAEYRARKKAAQRADTSKSPDDVPTGQSRTVLGLSVTATDSPRQPEPEPEPEPEPITSARSNPIWDALVEHVGAVATAPEKSRRGRVAKELTKAGATPDEIATRTREYRRRWPNVDLTDTALLNHWSKLGTRKQRGLRAVGAGGVELENAT